MPADTTAAGACSASATAERAGDNGVVVHWQASHGRHVLKRLLSLIEQSPVDELHGR